MLGIKTVRALRSFSTSAVNKGHHSYRGPGYNLPFDIQNKYKFTLYLAIFCSSGYALPFLMVKYIKNRSG